MSTRNAIKSLGRWSLLLAAATLPLASLAETTTPQPDALRQVLESQERSADDRQRDQTEHPAEVLAAAGVRPGMRVVDLLGGGGYYSELLAHAVGPKGQVLLINNPAYHAYARDDLKQRALASRLPNVEYRVVESCKLGLAPSSVDLVLLTITYHDLFYAAPEDGWPAIDEPAFMKQLAKSLKPGGVLLITDHRAEAQAGASVARSLHRIEESYARQHIEAAGFRLDASFDFLRNPADDHRLSVFDPAIRGKTDRFVHRYVKR